LVYSLALSRSGFSGADTSVQVEQWLEVEASP